MSLGWKIWNPNKSMKWPQSNAFELKKTTLYATYCSLETLFQTGPFYGTISNIFQIVLRFCVKIIKTANSAIAERSASVNISVLDEIDMTSWNDYKELVGSKIFRWYTELRIVFSPIECVMIMLFHGCFDSDFSSQKPTVHLDDVYLMFNQNFAHISWFSRFLKLRDDSIECDNCRILVSYIRKIKICPWMKSNLHIFYRFLRRRNAGIESFPMTIK